MNIFVPTPLSEREHGEIETVCRVLHGEFGFRKFMLDPKENERAPGPGTVTPSVMTEWCVRHGLEWAVEAATLWDVKLVRMRRDRSVPGHSARFPRPKAEGST